MLRRAMTGGTCSTPTRINEDADAQIPLAQPPAFDRDRCRLGVATASALRANASNPLVTPHCDNWPDAYGNPQTRAGKSPSGPAVVLMS